MELPLDVVLNVGGLILTAVVLVVGMKYALNGLREDIAEIKGDLKTLLASDAEQDVEIGRMEERIETHTGWLERLQEITERRGEARE